MKKIENIIGYKFKDKTLLETALTHSSYGYKYKVKHNERLEFLGDSILGFIVAEHLFKLFSQDEGILTKVRAEIVKCDYLSTIIHKFELDNFIKVFPANLIKSNTIKGDFFEALLGAIYLDGGLKECSNFIFKFIDLSKENLENFIIQTNDFKTKLQEIVQAKKGKLEYKVIGEEGKPNAKIFNVALFVNEKLICEAKEKSKQKAENLCAKLAIKNVKNLFD